jgi:hypothetical protein
MFRFKIRDVMWLTVLIALALAWWIDRSRLSRTLTQVRGDYLVKVFHMEQEKVRRDMHDWAFRNAQWQRDQQQRQATRPAADNCQ